MPNPKARPKGSHRGASTQAVHGGAARDKGFHALTTPIVQTATFAFKDTAELIAFLDAKVYGGELDREEYARYGNPSTWSLEARIAQLEGAGDALVYPSGMSAVTSLFLTVLRPGTHIIMTDDCYRRTRQFCLTTLKKFGIETSIVPMCDYDALEAAIAPGKTRLIFTETPTNPYLRVADLTRLVELARTNRILTLLDTTFATPVNLRPLEYGIDFVMHSATKYFGGHNDVLGGAIAGEAGRIKALKDARGMFGNVIDPHQAFLIERGLKTLAVRVRHQNAAALQVARFLERHSKIDRVYYPGLLSHPDHEIAFAQMSGFGGVVSFEVAGDIHATSDFIDRLRIPYIAPSLGGTESLIEQPAYVSYYDLSPQERQAAGIGDNLVRFALGIEDAEDIIADLDDALRGVPTR
ncbi:MAG: PLP-dependent aspartate aminotransferase family protein [Chloroflexi bacterium]|nr:PLP-dependent aspartate aminotransferase family protein [Chloroflexota bacterium]MCY4245953.1 PLP-dependent aspartate aminotransferase family protein [Chloroflexota bacterium]